MDQLWTEQIKNIKITFADDKKEARKSKSKLKAKKKKMSTKAKTKRPSRKKPKTEDESTEKSNGETKAIGRNQTVGELRPRLDSKRDLVMIKETTEISQNSEHYPSIREINYNEDEEKNFQKVAMRTMPAMMMRAGDMTNEHMFNKDSMKSIMKVLNSKEDSEKKDYKKSIFFSQVENKAPMVRKSTQKLNSRSSVETKNENKNSAIVKRLRRLKKNRKSYQTIRKVSRHRLSKNKKIRFSNAPFVAKRQVSSKKDELGRGTDKKVHFNLKSKIFKSQNVSDNDMAHSSQINFSPSNKMYFESMPSPVYGSQDQIDLTSYNHQMVDNFSEDYQQEQLTKRKESYMNINMLKPELQYNGANTNIYNFNNSQKFFNQTHLDYGKDEHKFGVNKYVNYVELSEK